MNLYEYAGDDPVNQIDPSGNGYEPIDEIVDLGLTAYDLYQVTKDCVQHASPGQKALDGVSLGLDAAGLLPIVPPGTGEGYRLARSGAAAVVRVNAERRQAQVIAHAAQGAMMMAAASGTGSASGGSSGASAPSPDAADLAQDALQLSRNGFTKAGRALQKHSNRAHSAFPNGGQRPDVLNSAAQNIIVSILKNPRVTVTPNRFGGFDWRLPGPRGFRNGMGISSQSGNLFRGFLEPGL